MNDKLTFEQAIFARNQMRRWLEIKFANEVREPKEYKIIKRDDYGNTYEKIGDPYWKDFPQVRQLLPDIDHSALLLRLLLGKPPLDEVPPVKNAYPIYPDD